jgi:hypothetical protein
VDGKGILAVRHVVRIAVGIHTDLVRLQQLALVIDPVKRVVTARPRKLGGVLALDLSDESDFSVYARLRPGAKDTKRPVLGVAESRSVMGLRLCVQLGDEGALCLCL